jgi:multidrug efflux system membrane fusion protein
MSGLYNQRKAENDLAKKEFERVSELIKTDAVSKQEFDQRQSAIATTAAMMKAQQAMIDQTKLKIEYCEIKSPIDGRVGSRMIDPGNIVKENDTILVTVQRLDPIYADFTVAENNLPLVRDYMRKGTLKARVKVPGEQGEGREGDLTFLDSSVQQGAGTIKLRATLENKDRHFWAGQYVEVRLVLEVIPNAILVPARAVQIGQSGPFVYTVNASSIAEMKPVRLGQKHGDWYVILEGVKAEENVILTGQMAVMPGAKVRVGTPPGSQPATTQAGAKQ